jgi:hypothetical protein
LNGLIYFQDSIKAYPKILKIQREIDIKQKAKGVEFSKVLGQIFPFAPHLIFENFHFFLISRSIR